MSQNSLLAKLKDLQLRFEEVGTLITDPAVIADQKRYVKLTKEYSDLEKINIATIRYEGLINSITEAREILDTETRHQDSLPATNPYWQAEQSLGEGNCHETEHRT